MYTAMPLEEGKIGLTSGVHTCDTLHCEEDGTIEITWRSGSPVTSYDMVAGDDRCLTPRAKSIEIKLGVFTII